jgi:hypothetical protein
MDNRLEHDLVGKSYSFDDGNVIEVIQLKVREVEGEAMPCVTYQIYQSGNLPRKLILNLPEFINNFGHLFGYTNTHSMDTKQR